MRRRLRPKILEGRDGKILTTAKTEAFRIRQFQSSVFEGWDTSLDVSSDPRLSKIIRILRGLPPGRMLDIGCGYGKLSAGLIKMGWQAVGIDIVREPLLSLGAEGVQPIRSDFRSTLPVRDQTFDMAFAGEVVEHTTSEKDFIGELARVLKPGGHLVITTPNLVSLRNRIYMFFGRLPLNAAAEFHYRIFTMESLRQLLESHGFRILTVASSYLLFFSQGTGHLHRYLPTAIKSVGERLGSIFPTLGDHLIVFAKKQNPEALGP